MTESDLTNEVVWMQTVYYTRDWGTEFHVVSTQQGIYRWFFDGGYGEEQYDTIEQAAAAFAIWQNSSLPEGLE